MHQQSELQNGGLEQYVEDRLFNERVGSLDGLLRRKEALSHKTRYTILYLLYETGVQGRKALVEATGKDEQGLEHHLKELQNANLIAKVPVPDGLDGRLTFYRITALGEHEIKSDLRLMFDPAIAQSRFRSRPGIGDEDAFFKMVGLPITRGPEPEQVNDYQTRLRERGKEVVKLEQ